MSAGRFRPASWLAVAALVSIAALGGCKDRSSTGELASPDDAPEFESRLRKAYDDDYTPQGVELSGRAPNDVLDQQLFAERLGFADVLVTVRVKQVFGKGRYQGRKDQYVAVELEEVMLGSLPDGIEDDQLLVVKGEDPLPSDLNERRLLLFVKWAPGEVPSYHHHLMPADDEVVAMISSMIKKAQEDGVLGADGEISSGRKARRRERKRRKNGESTDDDSPAI